MVSLFSSSLDRFLPSSGHFLLARILQIPPIMSGLLVRECEALLGGLRWHFLQRSPDGSVKRLPVFLPDVLVNIDTLLMVESSGMIGIGFKRSKVRPVSVSFFLKITLLREISLMFGSFSIPHRNYPSFSLLDLYPDFLFYTDYI